MSALEHIPTIDNGLLRFLTCGSVDDGKSTLIGRLLYDSRAILADTLQAIERTSRRRGLDAVDLSLLTDGLQAEREQGITIDVAYRYFSTGTRKYIIADAPGHEQYTRNMVTAASTADLAIILVDARRGVLTQTRRHSAIAHLLGIPRLVVAVNKMDLVGYDRDVFELIRTEYLAFAASLGIRDARFLPLSALNGDMVVERGTRLDWYAGPTLMEVLEGAPAAPQASADPELHDFRGFMGRVESGGIAVGERVRAQPSGLESRVREIRIGKRRLERAHRGQSVTLLLEDEIDISRGDMLARPGESPAELRGLEAMLCWLSARPLDRQRRYLVRHTTREVRASVAGIDYRLDVDAMERRAATRLDANDIGRVSLRLAGPLFADRYAANRATGAFVLIDESTNDTAAAGMIL